MSTNTWSPWDTHDNAADEWWWGCYNQSTWFAKNWTQADYDGSWWIRYFCRVAWHTRNAGYGFNYSVLGFSRDEGCKETTTFHAEADKNTWYEKTIYTNPNGKQAFKIKGYFYFTKNWYLDVNIGWKAHSGFTRLMYAGRIFAPRK